MKRIFYLIYYLLAAILIFYFLKSITNDGFIYTLCAVMDNGIGAPFCN